MRRNANPAGRPGRLALILAAAAGLAGCRDTPATVESDSTPPAVSAVVVTDPTVLAAMEEAIVDEYRAELTYRVVIDAFGAVRPFVNIVEAEVRHWQALARLYQRRGLAVPENPWTSDQIPVFETLAEACQTGVAAEIANATIYDKYLVLELPDDVRQVFQTNRDASWDNHLPAFERCS